MAGFLSFQLYEPAGKHKEIPEKGGDHFRKRRIFFFKIQCFLITGAYRQNGSGARK